MDTTDTDTRDRQDMARLIAGHEVALNDLMERHSARVIRFLRGMLKNEDDAQDLAQETFVRLYQNKQKFNLDATFSNWLYTIAANLARNQLRWRSRHPNVSLEAESPATEQALQDILPATERAPDEDTLAAERQAAVQTAVQALPADLREALVLCEWEERSVAAAAAILHTSPKAVESRLYRARKRLRVELQRWLP